MVEHRERGLRGVDDDAADRRRQGGGHGHLIAGGHGQPLGHGGPHAGQSGGDDVVEVGLERGAQGQRLRSGPGGGELRARVGAPGLLLGERVFERGLGGLRRLVGLIEGALALFDVLDRVFGHGECFTAVGNAGFDRRDLGAPGLDPGFEVGDAGLCLLLAGVEGRAVLHRLGDGDLRGLHLGLGLPQGRGELLLAGVRGLEGGRRCGDGLLGGAEFVADAVGLAAQLGG
nr:hypothetical protein [Brevibacterium casei]